MKRLISLLRFNLLLQAGIFLIILGMELAPLWSEGLRDFKAIDKKELAAIIWAGKMGLAGVLLTAFCIIALYRLQQGASFLYVSGIGFLTTLSLLDGRFHTLLHVPLMVSFGFVMGLVFFSPLRRIVKPPANAEAKTLNSLRFETVYRWATIFAVACALLGMSEKNSRKSERVRCEKCNGWKTIGAPSDKTRSDGKRA